MKKYLCLLVVLLTGVPYSYGVPTVTVTNFGNATLYEIGSTADIFAPSDFSNFAGFRVISGEFVFVGSGKNPGDSGLFEGAKFAVNTTTLTTSLQKFPGTLDGRQVTDSHIALTYETPTVTIATKVVDHTGAVIREVTGATDIVPLAINQTDVITSDGTNSQITNLASGTSSPVDLGGSPGSSTNATALSNPGGIAGTVTNPGEDPKFVYRDPSLTIHDLLTGQPDGRINDLDPLGLFIVGGQQGGRPYAVATSDLGNEIPIIDGAGNDFFGFLFSVDSTGYAVGDNSAGLPFGTELLGDHKGRLLFGDLTNVPLPADFSFSVGSDTVGGVKYYAYATEDGLGVLKYTLEASPPPNGSVPEPSPALLTLLSFVGCGCYLKRRQPLSILA